jgi:hypothetical protein
MRRKKVQPRDSLEALRQVRKPLPPPSRAKADDKKYRREAARQAARKEIEQEGEKE